MPARRSLGVGGVNVGNNGDVSNVHMMIICQTMEILRHYDMS